jgi:hypothetical protein
MTEFDINDFLLTKDAEVYRLNETHRVELEEL